MLPVRGGVSSHSKSVVREKELAEPHERGHIKWFAVLLTDVVKDCITNLDTVVVYAFPNVAIMEVKMHIGVVEPKKGVISYE